MTTRDIDTLLDAGEALAQALQHIVDDSVDAHDPSTEPGRDALQDLIDIWNAAWCAAFNGEEQQ